MDLKSLVAEYNNKIEIIKRLERDHLNNILIGSIGKYYTTINTLIENLNTIIISDDSSVYDILDFLDNTYNTIKDIYNILIDNEIQDNIRLRKSSTTFDEIYNTINPELLNSPFKISISKFDDFDKILSSSRKDTNFFDKSRSELSIKMFCKTHSLKAEEIYKIYKMHEPEIVINPLNIDYHPIQNISVRPWIKIDKVDANIDNANSINPKNDDLSYEDIKIGYEEKIKIIDKSSLNNVPIKKSEVKLVMPKFVKDSNLFTFDNITSWKFSEDVYDYNKYILIDNIEKNKTISGLVMNYKLNTINIKIPKNIMDEIKDLPTPKAVMLVYNFLKKDTKLTGGLPNLVSSAYAFVLKQEILPTDTLNFDMIEN